MIDRLRRTFDALRARTRFEREMRDEIDAHVQHRADDLVARGEPRDEALRRARVELGTIESYKEQCRDERGLATARPFLGLLNDFALAARRLAATPLFLLFAVVSLSLGVGVTTTAYSILYALLWRPLGITDVDRVAVVTIANDTGRPRWRRAVSRPDFEDLRRRQQVFRDVSAAGLIFQTVNSPTASEVTGLETVAGNFFATLRVEAALGRTIQPADDDLAAQVIVLSDRLWRRRFAADPAIVGRTVKIGGHPFEIVGVMPETFQSLQADVLPPAGWIPLRTTARFVSNAAAAPAADRERPELTIIGRVDGSRSIPSAAVELTAMGALLDREAPLFTPANKNGVRSVAKRQWSARPISSPDDAANANRMGATLIAIVGLVLIVACTNLANLMLSRGAARQHEIAVRRALGASRWRLVRELLAETVLIAAIGGVVTMVVLQALLHVATWEVPTVRGTFLLEPRLNVPALLVASSALLLSILVFGLEPALALTRQTVGVSLADGGSTGGLPRRGRQRAFIRWQVATSACFFLVTAILIRVMMAQALHDPGFALDRLALAGLYFPAQGWDEVRARRVIARALEAAREQPDLASVSVSSGMPFGLAGTPWANMTVPGHAVPRIQDAARMLSASPNIFGTLGIPLVRGRAFDDRDDAGAARVVVLSEKTARLLFGTADAIGRQVAFEVWGRAPAVSCTVIGVARDTDTGGYLRRTDDLVYVPFAQWYVPAVYLVAQTSGSPADAARLLQNTLRRVDPDLGSGPAGAAFWLTAGPYVIVRMAAALAGTLGALTLLLSMVGLYGVQMQAVAHRTREVGLRMALGAATAQIERMVLGEGFRPVVEGLLLGWLLGALFRGAIRTMLEAPIDVIDPAAFAMVPIPLAIAAAIACYAPARRAARVDPNVALRHL